MNSITRAGLVIVLATGCATSGHDRWPRTGDAWVDGLTAIDLGPSRDRVLWQYRTATVGMRRGFYAETAPLLDEALAVVNGIYGRDSEARRSRRYFAAEARKTFIGEPYERVMAYYYRGILYWMNGELDNARACFRGGQFMDADATEATYASDYVLLDYLDGWTTARLGGDGQDALARARAVARDAVPPDFDLAANVLLFIEFGRGPTKYATGEYREELRFHPGQSAARTVRVRSGDRFVEVGPYDDLTFQATTRGGRVMDHVLANKAVFKRATDTAGNAALITGAIMAGQQGHHSPVDEIGAGLMIAGLVSKLVSAATTPDADARAWDNLPQYLSFAALQLPAGKQTLTVEFLDAGGQPLPDRTRTLTFEVVPTGPETVLFASDQTS